MLNVNLEVVRELSHLEICLSSVSMTNLKKIHEFKRENLLASFQMKAQIFLLLTRVNI